MAVVLTGPAFQADFTGISSLPSWLSFSRATTGTYFDASGVLQTAAIDAPRFDHAWNGSAWVAVGLLIEEQRTNSALHSGIIGGTDWSLFAGATVSTNAVIGPDGTTSGTTITFANNDVSQVYQGAGGSAATYSLSIWAKSSTGKKFRIVFTEGAVNRNSPDFTTTSSWQRFTFVWTATGGVSQISVCNVAAADAGSIDAWGFQFEQGAFPTSYIPTTTAAVTRSADIVQLTGAAATQLNTAPLSLIAEGQVIQGAVPNYNMFVADASDNQWLAVHRSTSNQVDTLASGGTEVFAALGSGNIYSPYRAALAGDNSGVSIVSNGGTVTTDAAHGIKVTGTPYLGSDGSGNTALNGWFRSLAIYSSRLSDTDLQAKSVVGAAF